MPWEPRKRRSRIHFFARLASSALSWEVCDELFEESGRVRGDYAAAGFLRVRRIDGCGIRTGASASDGMPGMRGTIESRAAVCGKPGGYAAGRGSNRFGGDSAFAVPQRAGRISG